LNPTGWFETIRLQSPPRVTTKEEVSRERKRGKGETPEIA
jgi:hypothetical protein